MQPRLTWLFNQIHKTQEINLSQKNTKIELSLTNKEQKTLPKLSKIPTQITQLRNKKSYLFASFPVLKRVFVYYVWLRVIAAQRKAYSIVVRWWAQLLRKPSVVAWWEWMFVGVGKLVVNGGVCGLVNPLSHSIPNLFEAANWDHHGVFGPPTIGNQVGVTAWITWIAFFSPMNGRRFAGQYWLEFVEGVDFLHTKVNYH